MLDHDGEYAVLKRCLVCGQDFDASEPDQWVCARAHRGRHIPDDTPGTVYILHFDAPTMVADADNGHVQPTTHYVGWSRQQVTDRVRQHRVPESSVVHTRDGSAQDESRIKQQGTLDEWVAVDSMRNKGVVRMEIQAAPDVELTPQAASELADALRRAAAAASA